VYGVEVRSLQERTLEERIDKEQYSVKGSPDPSGTLFAGVCGIDEVQFSEKGSPDPSGTMIAGGYGAGVRVFHTSVAIAALPTPAEGPEYEVGVRSLVKRSLEERINEEQFSVQGSPDPSGTMVAGVCGGRGFDEEQFSGTVSSDTAGTEVAGVGSVAGGFVRAHCELGWLSVCCCYIGIQLYFGPFGYAAPICRDLGGAQVQAGDSVAEHIIEGTVKEPLSRRGRRAAAKAAAAAAKAVAAPGATAASLLHRLAAAIPEHAAALAVVHPAGAAAATAEAPAALLRRQAEALEALSDSLRRRRVELAVELAVARRDFASTRADLAQSQVQSQLLEVELAAATCEVTECVVESNGDFRLLCGEGSSVLEVEAFLASDALLAGLCGLPTS
jgi:hypothetical protein